MSRRRIRRRHGVWAAVAAVAGAGVFGAVGVAGADDKRGAAAADVTIEARGTGSSSRWADPDGDSTARIQTGDTVTWSFVDPTHNVVSTSSEGDPDWESFEYPDGAEANFEMGDPGSSVPFTFDEAGTYTFVCTIHSTTMTGTVEVTDEEPTPTPTPTPDPDPDPDPDPEPTPDPDPEPDPDPDPDPSPQPSNPNPGGATTQPGMQHGTPAPSIAASADQTAPAITRIRTRTLRNRRVRLRFSLSEPASVTVRFNRKGRKKAARSARVMGHAGRNTVRVRSRAFKRGRRFVARLQARDALGNRSGPERKRLTIRRRG